MTILLCGANGQLGRELLNVLEKEQVVAATRSGRLPDGQSCACADFHQPDQVIALLEQLRPRLIINAAAYTQVDQAESEREAVFRVNAHTPAAMAQWCAHQDVPWFHYSTDYVFNGQANAPYPCDAAVDPLGIYGQSKRAGEEAIVQAEGRAIILRTAWVYAVHGHNFFRTMLRLAQSHHRLRVVADQIGTPTPARLIAQTTAKLIQHGDFSPGIWHLTARGQTSWYGFATAIFASANARGLLSHLPEVEAISSQSYPTAARRPAYSVLDTQSLERRWNIRLPMWADGLADVFDQWVAQGWTI